MEQKNTAEAMLHSFRAVEGLLWAWMREYISGHFKEGEYSYPQLLSSITSKYPNLKSCFTERQEIELKGNIQKRLFEEAIPATKTNFNFQTFWNRETREKRNVLSHRLGGITEGDLFQAWGQDIKNQQQWEKRVLNCLNLITEQSFQSLSQASLFAQIHPKIKRAIADYELKL